MTMTLAGVQDWLKNAAPGERITYHTGKTIWRKVDGVSRKYESADFLLRCGLVELVQKRLPDRSFAYIAIRNRKTDRPDQPVTNKWAAEDVEALRELRRRNVTRSEIAERLGRTKGAVIAAINRYENA